MFDKIKIFTICLWLPALSGCAGLFTYFEDMQKQSVDDFEQRSVYFQPQYRFKAPDRDVNLTPAERRLLGAPPPRQGKVVLDGTRYYSANGHVCQYISTAYYKPGAERKSACFINGRWVLAAPVLNARPNP